MSDELTYEECRMALLWLESEGSSGAISFNYGAVARELSLSRQNVWSRIPVIMTKLGVPFQDRDQLVCLCVLMREDLIEELRVRQQRLKRQCRHRTMKKFVTIKRYDGGR